MGFKVGGVQGGVPLLATSNGEIVFAYDTLGRGRFFAFSGFYTFSQAVMGPTSVTPNRQQREVFEMEYQILEILSGERRPLDIKPYLQAEEPAGGRAGAAGL
jgi:hypothetical protein